MVRVILLVIFMCFVLIGILAITDPYFADELYYWLFWLGLACIAFPFVVLAIVAFAMWSNREFRERTYIDGALPMIKKKQGGNTIYIDPNRIVSATWIIDRFGNVIEQTPAAGWLAQERYNHMIEATNIARASNPGDNLFGAIAGIFNRGRRALKIPKMPDPQLLEGPVEEIVDAEYRQIDPEPVSFSTVVNNDTPDELPLGTSAKGEIVLWEPNLTPHLRVHGASRIAGKTNLLKQVVLAALQLGHQVVVADRRAFKDWTKFKDSVQFVDTNKRGTFYSLVLAILALYKKRDELLADAHVGDITELNGEVKRIFIVLSEFGNVLRSLEGDEKAEVIKAIKTIVSESGATGVHILAEDQVHNFWPREIRGNMTPVTGFLPRDAVGGGGYTRAYELESHEFNFDGQRFKSWDISRNIPSAGDTNVLDLSNITQYHDITITSDESQSEQVDDVDSNRNIGALKEHMRVWRFSNPEGTQSQLLRDFAALGIKVSQSYVSKLWNRLEKPDDQP